MSKKVSKLTLVQSGKEKKPRAEASYSHKDFRNLQAGLSAKENALEAKFSAAEMGQGNEAKLGRKYLRLLKDEMEKALRSQSAHAAYKTQNPKEIKNQKLLAEYCRALEGLHAVLDSLEYDFDIELERGRTGEAARDVMVA